MNTLFANNNQKTNINNTNTDLMAYFLNNNYQYIDGESSSEFNSSIFNTNNLIGGLSFKSDDIIDTTEEDNKKINEIFRIKPYKGRNILIADDDLVCRVYTYTVLDKMGFSVTIAKDGKEALHLFEKGNFDLVFMDIKMPIMDGFEATSIIRKTKDKKTPIIAMSAYSQIDIIQESKKQGMNDYMVKPIAIKNIISIIKKWIPE